MWANRVITTHFLWVLFCTLLLVDTPLNLQQFLNLSRNRGESLNSRMIVLLAYVCWSLWLVQNDYVKCGDSSVDYVSAKVEHLNQGQGKRLDFKDGGQAIKIFGAKRPKLVM